jgi:hypothetical protein
MGWSFNKVESDRPLADERKHGPNKTIETIGPRQISAGQSAHHCLLGSPRVNSLRDDVTLRRPLFKAGVGAGPH